MEPIILAPIAVALIALFVIFRIFRSKPLAYEGPAIVGDLPALPVEAVAPIARQDRGRFAPGNVPTAPRGPDGKYRKKEAESITDYALPIAFPVPTDQAFGSFDPTYPSWGDDQFVKPYGTAPSPEPFGFGDSGSASSDTSYSSDFSGGGGDFGGGGAGGSWD